MSWSRLLLQIPVHHSSPAPAMEATFSFFQHNKLPHQECPTYFNSMSTLHLVMTSLLFSYEVLSPQERLLPSLIF